MFKYAPLMLALILAAPDPSSAQGITLTEGPAKNRLYARNRDNVCAVTLQGKLSAPADRAVLNVYKNGALLESKSQNTSEAFTFSSSLQAGLIDYRFEILATLNGAQAGAWGADSVACGDAYMIYGQSNAEALYGTGNYTYRNGWIRTYRGGWKQPGSTDIGVWGVHLARQIVEKQQMPVCIINGAKGNTSIKELGPDFVIPENKTEWINDTKPYGNYYKRLKGWVTEAGLLGRIPALLFHQGEKQVYGNDYKNYYAEFMEFRKSVYADFPELRKIIMYQIRSGCGGGSVGWNVMFETQRQLARDLEDVEILSTFAPNIIACHYGEHDLPGYLTIAEWMYPKIDSSYYGGKYTRPLSPPDLLQAAYTSAKKDEVVLLFDQDVTWTDSTVYDTANAAHIPWFKKGNRTAPTFLRTQFVMDSTTTGQVASGYSQGRKVFLKLKSAADYKKIAYPPYNQNGAYPGPYVTGTASKLGALAFYVPIAPELSPTGLGGRLPQAAPASGAKLKISRVAGRRVRLEWSGPFAGRTGDIRLEIRDLRGGVVWRREGVKMTQAGGVEVEVGILPNGLYLGIARQGRQAFSQHLAIP